jgi:hypothetical protein
MEIDPKKLKALRVKIREEFEQWGFDEEDPNADDFREAGEKIVEGMKQLIEAVENETFYRDEKRKIEMATFIWEQVVEHSHFGVGHGPAGAIYFYADMPGIGIDGQLKTVVNIVELVEEELHISGGESREYWLEWADAIDRCSAKIREAVKPDAV